MGWKLCIKCASSSASVQVPVQVQNVQKSVLLPLQRLIFELTCYFQLNLVLGKNCIFFLQIFHVKVNIARDPAGYLQLPWVCCASVGNPTTRIPNSSVRPRPSQKFVCNGSVRGRRVQWIPVCRWVGPADRWAAALRQSRLPVAWLNQLSSAHLSIGTSAQLSIGNSPEVEHTLLAAWPMMHVTFWDRPKGLEFWFI